MNDDKLVALTIKRVLSEELALIAENNWNSEDGKPAPEGTQSAVHDNLTKYENLKHENYYKDGDTHVNQYGHAKNRYGHAIHTYHDKDDKDPKNVRWARSSGAGLVSKRGVGAASLNKHLSKHPLPEFTSGTHTFRSPER